VATFVLVKRNRNPGEIERSAQVNAPANLVTATITINMDVADVTNPATDVNAFLEWDPDGAGLRFLAGTRLEGRPNNYTGPGFEPFISLGPEVCVLMRGKPVRGTLQATTTVGTVGATVEIT